MSDYKIWYCAPFSSIKDFKSDPSGLDHIHGLSVNLYEQLIWEDGELQQALYYSKSDGIQYTDLILQIDYKWTRAISQGGTLRLIERKELFKWVTTDSLTDTDPTFGPHVKSSTQYYDIREAAIADQKRRGVIVERMLGLVSMFDGLTTEIQDFIKLNDELLSSYIRLNDREIINSVTNITDPWVDQDASLILTHLSPGVTLRDIIITTLNYTDL